MSARVVLATRNTAKLGELRRILSAAGLTGLEVVGLDDVAPFPETPETGETFEANALTKARGAAAATGLPAVADDSGLEVDALHGMPGVLSARWAGRHGDDEANLRLVLDQVRDVPEQRRGAAFVCAAALVVPPASPAPDAVASGAVAADAVASGAVAPGPAETVVHGRWPGRLAHAPRGGNGFGYDPIFIPEGESRTSAELSPEEKDAVSHRGRALRALLPALRDLI